VKSLPLFKKVLNMAPRITKDAPCQEQVIEADQVDLAQLPIQTLLARRCRAFDYVGAYRHARAAQRASEFRHLPSAGHRAESSHHALALAPWRRTQFSSMVSGACRRPVFPVAVALGADPATILAAVTPVSDTLSEFAFAGLLRGARTEQVKCQINSLLVPTSAEIVLEGFIRPAETAPEGPFGDHTGYYNEVEAFPVFTVERITHRADPIYHGTYTRRPPDEPAILGLVLNEVFIPLLQKQSPKIIDFYLPPEGCSYRLAVISMKKQYPGHAKRVTMGVWAYLKQFMYTKFVIVTDGIDVRDWKDIIWALTTRMDPMRDTLIVENTPINCLDFAAPVSGIGSKIGFDATHKMPWRNSAPAGPSNQDG